MNIALCFYGQPRFYGNKEILEFLRDLRSEKINADIYMHLWKPMDSKNYLRSPWSNIEDDHAFMDLENLKEKIEDIYNPVSLIIEDERNILSDPSYYKRTPSPTSPEIVHRMFYSQMMVGESLEKSGKDYDLVFKIRTDSAVKGLKDLYKLVGSKIWVPDNCPMLNLFNDNFSISSKENFLKMSKAYQNLKTYYDQGADMNGEPMLKAHVRNLGIEHLITKNRFINVGLVRSENPLRLQGIWYEDVLRHKIQFD